MDSRTTSTVDRRLVEHVVRAVPGDVTQEVIKAHLDNGARSHNLIRQLLKTNPELVDFEAFLAVLKRGVKEFTSPDVLEQIRALGGQFTDARLTTVPGGETFDDQRNRKVIKFWTDWHFKKEERPRLTVVPSIASQVIYLPNLVEGSLRCTYDKTDEVGRLCVAEVLASLPKVGGLRWIVGNAPTINRVLANHLKETGIYLLPSVWTWATDSYESLEYGLFRLIVGHFDDRGVDVHGMRPGGWLGYTGVFVLGVPDAELVSA